MSEHELPEQPVMKGPDAEDSVMRRVPGAVIETGTHVSGAPVVKVHLQESRDTGDVFAGANPSDAPATPTSRASEQAGSVLERTDVIPRIGPEVPSEQADVSATEATRSLPVVRPFQQEVPHGDGVRVRTTIQTPGVPRGLDVPAAGSRLVRPRGGRKPGSGAPRG